MEPLHTVLLGVLKYAWALTTAYINTKHSLPVLEARMRSANVDGLSIESLRAAYLIQYRGGLIGRQFKAIIQLIVFSLHGLVPDEIRNMWISAGNMVSLLWFTEFNIKSNYLVCETLYQPITYADGSHIVIRIIFKHL